MARRLAVVFPHVLLGGGEVAMMEVAERLKARFAVTVLALEGGLPPVGATIRDELAERFPDSSFLVHRGHLPSSLARADAVLWYGLNGVIPKALARLTARPASLRVVHTERPEEVAFARRWRSVIDAVVSVSPSMARQIPGAVFIPNPLSRGRLQGERHEFFPPGRKTLGFLGRLAPMKNVPWLIENLASLEVNLLLQAIDTELLTVADLTRLAQEKGVAERVRFLPPGREVGTLLRSIDALVLPSASEAFPLAVLEAGALGVPVIATRVGALPELFGPEILFLESQGGIPEVGSLRQAIAAIDPAWGQRLQARAAALCDPEGVATCYGELLDGLLSPSSSASGPR